MGWTPPEDASMFQMFSLDRRGTCVEQQKTWRWVARQILRSCPRAPTFQWLTMKLPRLGHVRKMRTARMEAEAVWWWAEFKVRRQKTSVHIINTTSVLTSTFNMRTTLLVKRKKQTSSNLLQTLTRFGSCIFMNIFIHDKGQIVWFYRVTSGFDLSCFAGWLDESWTLRGEMWV